MLQRSSKVRVVKSRFRDAAARAAVNNRSSCEASSQKNSSASNELIQDTLLGNYNNSTNAGSGTKPKIKSIGNKKHISTNTARTLIKTHTFGSSLALSKPSVSKILSASNTSGGSSFSKSSANLSGDVKAIDSKKLSSKTASPCKYKYNINKCPVNRKENVTPSKAKASSRIYSSSSRAASKLHSTAVNATILNTTLQTANTPHFSSTVLSQRGRGFSPNLPDLPDISAIKLDLGNNSGKSSMVSDPDVSCEPPITRFTVPSPSNDANDDEVGQLTQVSAEDLELSYLQYLTWCHVNAAASAAHHSVVQPAL
ncbi:uncharacterized protein LOC108671694, partial [Hyalella azteca]|uniref:Uncharacterized protein LOC108671694 n=1 Tax=Hyalella azteca TaxID=294128 RepID=A0A8B7NM70_HYAAZ